MTLTVLRCTACGDTFPADLSPGEKVPCPSCGSTEVSGAHEPLL